MSQFFEYLSGELIKIDPREKDNENKKLENNKLD